MKDVEPGVRVCIKGQGTDAMLHWHGKVARLTKTMIILENGRRFRRNDLSSIPYQPYGGSKISTECQVR